MQDRPQFVLPNGPDPCIDTSRAEALRAEICSDRDFSCPFADDALSGAIAKRAGFNDSGISGRSISCSLNYRDANEASWNQPVEAVERVANLTELPAIVNGGCDFGNFKHAHLPAQKLTSTSGCRSRSGQQRVSKTKTLLESGMPPPTSMKFLVPAGS